MEVDHIEIWNCDSEYMDSTLFITRELSNLTQSLDLCLDLIDLDSFNEND